MASYSLHGNRLEMRTALRGVVIANNLVVSNDTRGEGPGGVTLIIIISILVGTSLSPCKEECTALLW
jgi:hypothetical protein